MNKQELLTLPLIHKEINTCTDDNLNTICEKLKRTYSLSFFDVWDFYFDENEKEVQKNIYLPNEINYENVLKFNGLRLEDMQFSVWEDMLKEIKENLSKNIPIMLHMYRKLFPWDINYMKDNVPDFFTHKAMAIDINENSILFIDGFCNKNNEYLSIEECKQCATNKLTKIIIQEKNEIDVKEYFNNFKNNQYTKKHIFKNIEKFAEEIQKEDIYQELSLYTGDLYKYSPMYNSLNKITRSRKKVKQLLKDIGESLNNMHISNLSNEFDKTISRWEYINSIFIKYAITLNKQNLQKATKYLLEIIEIEKNLKTILEGIDI